MTREILNKIAKAKKINIELFDHVLGYINEAYTKVYVIFASMEVCGGRREFYNRTVVTFNVSALMKKEEHEWEYATQDWEWISDIK